MRFPSAARSKYQDVGRTLQPGRGSGKLHDHRRIETGNMGELKIRPGFSVRQLRFGERAGNPSLVATARFPFCQCQ